MPSTRRSHVELRVRLPRRVLGVLGLGVAVGLAPLTAGWAVFLSNSVNTAAISAAPDWTAPSVSIVDPGSAIGGTVTITAAATDAETGIASVTIAWATSGTTTWTTLCVDAAAPFGCVFSTVGLPEDYIDLRAIATDKSGYSTTAVYEGVLVDNVTPAVSLQTIPSPMNGVVTISASATDGGSGVAAVSIQRAIAGGATWTTICTDVDAPHSCRFDSTLVNDGSYDFRAIVNDVAGNTATSTLVRNRIVSNTVSSVSVEPPSAFLRGTVTLAANANASTGVASVRIQRHATGTSTWVDVCTDTIAPYTCSWNTTTVTDGGYSFRAILTDNVGQITTSAVVGPSQVDNAAVRGSDVRTVTGDLPGRVSAGDGITFTYSRAMKPSSIVTGWDGSPRGVVVRLRDGLLLGLANNQDTLDVFTSSTFTTPVNLGALNLGANYVKNSKFVAFSATMSLSASGTEVTLTLGSPLGSTGTLLTVTSAESMVWTPSAAALDTTNIACSTAPVPETGLKDRDF